MDDTILVNFPDGDSNKTNRGEHGTEAVECIAIARGLPAAEGRGGHAAPAVPRP